jgi:hypothetical protein
MIPFIVLALIVIVALLALIAWITHTQSREREAWGEERRFLIDRTIARHMGEVVAIEREQKSSDAAVERVVRPLLEGLS